MLSIPFYLVQGHQGALGRSLNLQRIFAPCRYIAAMVLCTFFDRKLEQCCEMCFYTYTWLDNHNYMLWLRLFSCLGNFMLFFFIRLYASYIFMGSEVLSWLPLYEILWPYIWLIRSLHLFHLRLLFGSLRGHRVHKRFASMTIYMQARASHQTTAGSFYKDLETPLRFMSPRHYKAWGGYFIRNVVPLEKHMEKTLIKTVDDKIAMSSHCGWMPRWCFRPQCYFVEAGWGISCNYFFKWRARNFFVNWLSFLAHQLSDDCHCLKSQARKESIAHYTLVSSIIELFYERLCVTTGQILFHQ